MHLPAHALPHCQQLRPCTQGLYTRLCYVQQFLYRLTAEAVVEALQPDSITAALQRYTLQQHSSKMTLQQRQPPEQGSPGNGAGSLLSNALPVGAVLGHLAQEGALGLGQQRQRARVQDAAQRDRVGAVAHQLAFALVPDVQQLL